MVIYLTLKSHAKLCFIFFLLHHRCRSRPSKKKNKIEQNFLPHQIFHFDLVLNIINVRVFVFVSFCWFHFEVVNMSLDNKWFDFGAFYDLKDCPGTMEFEPVNCSTEKKNINTLICMAKEAMWSGLNRLPFWLCWTAKIRKKYTHEHFLPLFCNCACAHIRSNIWFWYINRILQKLKRFIIVLLVNGDYFACAQKKTVHANETLHGCTHTRAHARAFAYTVTVDSIPFRHT